MDDPDNIRWSWIGDGRVKDGIRYYDRAKVRVLSDGTERIFSVGDTVYVSNDSDKPWIAQIVQLSEKASALDDPEVTVVDENNASMRMKCTLRWFYNPEDVDEDVKRMSLFKRISKTEYGKHEYLWSDHVEQGGSNGLEVIEGRAYIVDTIREFKRLTDEKPQGFWDGDQICICRLYYGNKSSSHKIRELEQGELAKLLKEPGLEPLFNRINRASKYGSFTAVLKGTRRPQSYAVDGASHDTPPRDLPPPVHIAKASKRFLLDEDGIPLNFGQHRPGRQGGSTDRSRSVGRSRAHRDRMEISSDDSDHSTRRRRKREKENRSRTGLRRMVVTSDDDDDDDDDGEIDRVSTAQRPQRLEEIECSGNVRQHAKRDEKSRQLSESRKAKQSSSSRFQGRREIIEDAGGYPRAAKRSKETHDLQEPTEPFTTKGDEMDIFPGLPELNLDDALELGPDLNALPSNRVETDSATLAGKSNQAAMPSKPGMNVTEAKAVGIESDETNRKMRNLKEAVDEFDPEERKDAAEKLESIVDTLLKVMIEEDMTFNDGEGKRAALVRSVANRIYG